MLSAIILVFAVSLILSNIFYRHQIDVSQAARSLHSDQAFLIALSGEGWATELLFEDFKARYKIHQYEMNHLMKDLSLLFNALTDKAFYAVTDR